MIKNLILIFTGLFFLGCINSGTVKPETPINPNPVISGPNIIVLILEKNITSRQAHSLKIELLRMKLITRVHINNSVGQVITYLDKRASSGYPWVTQEQIVKNKIESYGFKVVRVSRIIY